MKRSIEIKVRLNRKEAETLDKRVKKSGLSREGYLRHLINGSIPREAPPTDYFAMMQQLYRIGNAQPDELVTLINTVVERIYITTEEDKRICQIFIKGCTTEDYTEIFGAADYIAHNAVQPVTAEAKMCDSEQYSICTQISSDGDIPGD